MPKQHDDPAPDPDLVLMTIVNRVVRGYMNDRAKNKSGIDPDNFKANGKTNWEAVPISFKEARQSIGESLFLEFRSRREQAFVAHFAQTLFATKHFLPEDQFNTLGNALINRTEDVKTLTLMSLSANSWSSTSKKENPQ